MADKKLRTIEQGGDVLVLGTDQIRVAADFAGLSNDKGIFWDGSSPGLFARRSGEWSPRGDYMTPKDTRPGVLFMGVRRPTTGPEADRELLAVRHEIADATGYRMRDGKAWAPCTVEAATDTGGDAA